MGLSLADLAGMSLQRFDALVRAWNRLKDPEHAPLSDEESDGLAAMLGID